MTDPALLVGAGGAVGAVLRHLVGEALDAWEFPLSTFVVNVFGSFVLGVAVFSGVSDSVVFFVGTGACGAFTTFSSFSFETVRMWETGARTRAALNVAGNLVFSLTAVGLAWLALS